MVYGTARPLNFLSMAACPVSLPLRLCCQTEHMCLFEADFSETPTTWVFQSYEARVSVGPRLRVPTCEKIDGPTAVDKTRLGRVDDRCQLCFEATRHTVPLLL